MAIQDPIAAYNAANPYDATVLCQALESEGIEAHVIDEENQAGIWLGGLVPEPNKTQIWIDRSNVERARVFFEDYERRAAELVQGEFPASLKDGPVISVICDECGKVNDFPFKLKGSVQSCESCGTYLDVGETVEDANAEWVQAEDTREA